MPSRRSATREWLPRALIAAAIWMIWKQKRVARAQAANSGRGDVEKKKLVPAAAVREALRGFAHASGFTWVDQETRQRALRA